MLIVLDIEKVTEIIDPELKEDSDPSDPFKDYWTRVQERARRCGMTLEEFLRHHLD